MELNSFILFSEDLLIKKSLCNRVQSQGKVGRKKKLKISISFSLT